MICKECQYREMEGIISGQGFTQWTCSICGNTYWHQNTDVPKVCPKCSSEHNVCEKCGKKI